MVPYHIIRKKREGEELTESEIYSFVSGYVKGDIPDYQMSAFLMAIFFKGMTHREILSLTKAYISSGETLNFSEIGVPTADKHSTGGVGDKVSLPLSAMVSACGIAVPMISGRGLGHTGGTLDKLESIPAFRTSLSVEQCKKQLREIGVFICAQSDEIVPADKKIYALRDVTATVDSIPLIVASIMSKKLAEGTDALVLDVKFGNGAFMREYSDAKTLAETMVGVGKSYGVSTCAILTDMNQPIGISVGNALEVAESIRYLRNDTVPYDLHTLILELGARMLVLTGAAGGIEEAKSNLEKSRANGFALEKFRKMIIAQGGDPRVCDNIEHFPKAPVKCVLKAKKSGWISGFDTYGIGILGIEMGVGRRNVNDTIDPRNGFEFLAKIGDWVEKDQEIAIVHCATETQSENIISKLEPLITISEKKISSPPLIRDEIK